MLDTLTFEIERQAREKGLEDLIEVHHAILGLSLPAHVDAVFLIPNTADNQQSIFEGAQELWRQRVSDTFLIMGGAEANGYPGSENWYKWFSPRVQGARVDIIPNSGNVNTLSKFLVLEPYARRTAISSVAIVAAPFHQLRAYMTGASVEIRHESRGDGPALRLYAHQGTELQWDEEALHSQGTTKDTRRRLLGRELDQIRKFQSMSGIGSPTPDIEPAYRVLEYIEHVRRSTR